MYARTHFSKSLVHPNLSEKWQAISSTNLAKAAVWGTLMLLGLLYVVQMNMTATKGYEIRELERSVTQLEKDASVLKLQAMELQSMERVMVQLPEVQLVKARPDGFISPVASAVATR